jgi:hypothetical protein
MLSVITFPRGVEHAEPAEWNATGFCHILTGRAIVCKDFPGYVEVTGWKVSECDRC